MVMWEGRCADKCKGQEIYAGGKQLARRTLHTVEPLLIMGHQLALSFIIVTRGSMSSKLQVSSCFIPTGSPLPPYKYTFSLLFVSSPSKPFKASTYAANKRDLIVCGVISSSDVVVEWD